MSVARTVVIGGGVVGAATAYYLARQGEQVTLVDQAELASGCSRGNAGAIILPHTPVTDLRIVLGRASAVVTSDQGD